MKEHCNKCGLRTNHEILHKEISTWREDIDKHTTVEGGDIYYMIKCLGCGYVHLRHDEWFSEDYDDEGNPIIRTRFYPPLTSRKKPDWLGSFDSVFWAGDTVIEQLLSEIYEALHNGSLRLATMGIRSLLEHIMIDKVGDHGSIGKNVEAFIEYGYISEKDRSVFREYVLEAGHAAMHRDFRPNLSDVKTLLDITEGLIASIYIHPKRAEKLAEKIPQRGKSNKKNK